MLSEITLSGRHTGPFTVFEDGKLAQVLPPTGRAFAVRQFHLHRLRGDEIVGHSAVRDDLGMLTQIGAFPPDPRLLARTLAWRITGRAARAGKEAITLAEAAAAAARPAPAPSGRSR